MLEGHHNRVELPHMVLDFYRRQLEVCEGNAFVIELAHKRYEARCDHMDTTTEGRSKNPVEGDCSIERLQ
jgi:hypothetical protein